MTDARDPNRAAYDAARIAALRSRVFKPMQIPRIEALIDAADAHAATSFEYQKLAASADTDLMRGIYGCIAAAFLECASNLLQRAMELGE